jgi:autotransporter family porin
MERGFMKRLVFVSILLSLLNPSIYKLTTPQSPPTSTHEIPLSAAALTPRAFIALVVSAPTVTHFNTLSPGSQLPSDATCAASVRPAPENKSMNVTYNATRGSQSLSGPFFAGGDPRANTQIATRVSGNYAGTTDQIIQWVACKWGIDEDVVRAQASLESWWRQTNLGNWTSDASRCAPGHGLGADGQAGQCPSSFGALQVKYYFYSSAWPGIANSTAFNLDTAYAVWRACFEGYEWWLNDVTHVGTYGAGDMWGCIGRWNTGKWHIPAAETYISDVKSRLTSRFWEQPVFQEP